MVRFSAASMVGFAFLFQTSFSGAQTTQPTALHSASNPAQSRDYAALSALPPLPTGRSTVMGGIIRDFNPVSDAFKLKVFGGRRAVPMLFDARTQVYRDGKKIPITDLRAGDHASVETTQDGNNIYALRIHMLSRTPEGQCQGQVLDYNASTGMLTLAANLSSTPIKLLVPAGTTIARTGQSNFTAERSGVSDLTNGTLVSIRFRSGNKGRGIADHISILATPGSSFGFSGTVANLDLSKGRVTLVNSTDGNSYDVFVNPRELRDKNLHEGEHVRVSAKFNGSRYIASSLSAE